MLHRTRSLAFLLIAIAFAACSDAAGSALSPSGASRYEYPAGTGGTVIESVGVDDGSWNFNLQGADAVAFFTKLRPSLTARSQATVQRYIDEINSVLSNTGSGYGVFVNSSRNSILQGPGGKYLSLTNHFEINVAPCQICGVALR